MTFTNTVGFLLMGKGTMHDHVLIYKRWNLSLVDVQSFRGIDHDTDHHLVVAKYRQKLSVSK
jgi:hypothetical protein